MAREPVFFEYNPRQWRLVLWLCLVTALLLLASATARARATGEVLAWARVGLNFGLGAAFVWILHRIRRRPGWGVKLDRSGLSVARPLSGTEPIELDWSDV